MIEFMGALYNEEHNLDFLIQHIAPYVDKFNFVDDGSTDNTGELLDLYFMYGDNTGIWLDYTTIEHTGLPETVKAKGLSMCDPDSWVIMLDADERFAPGVLPQIVDFLQSDISKDYTHVWFSLQEAIDGVPTRSFAKCRLFRASAAHFSDTVHVSDSFSGAGFNGGWTVFHHKTSAKQIQREKEYLETYQRLLNEGKIDEARVEEMKSFHYFVK